MSLLAWITYDERRKVIDMRRDFTDGGIVRREVSGIAGIEVAALARLSVFEQRFGLREFVKDFATVRNLSLAFNLRGELPISDEGVDE